MNCWGSLKRWGSWVKPKKKVVKWDTRTEEWFCDNWAWDRTPDHHHQKNYWRETTFPQTAVPAELMGDFDFSEPDSEVDELAALERAK